MHININFILLQEFDVEYYSICFILILKVKFISKMKWKCIFSEISPQSNPLRELITPPTKLAGPGGRPCRPTGGDCRVSRADYVSTQPYRVHSLDNAKTGEYRRYMTSGCLHLSVCHLAICQSWPGYHTSSERGHSGLFADNRSGL